MEQVHQCVQDVSHMSYMGTCFQEKKTAKHLTLRCTFSQLER